MNNKTTKTYNNEDETSMISNLPEDIMVGINKALNEEPEDESNIIANKSDSELMSMLVPNLHKFAIDGRFRNETADQFTLYQLTKANFLPYGKICIDALHMKMFTTEYLLDVVAFMRNRCLEFKTLKTASTRTKTPPITSYLYQTTRGIVGCFTRSNAEYHNTEKYHHLFRLLDNMSFKVLEQTDYMSVNHIMSKPHNEGDVIGALVRYDYHGISFNIVLDDSDKNTADEKLQQRWGEFEKETNDIVSGMINDPKVCKIYKKSDSKIKHDAVVWICDLLTEGSFRAFSILPSVEYYVSEDMGCGGGYFIYDIEKYRELTKVKKENIH